jgi:hypothetical protein
MCNKLVHFSTWPTGHQLVLKFYALHSREQKICWKKLCILATNSTLNGVIAIVNCSKPLLSLMTLFMDISAKYSWAQITMKGVMSELLGGIDFALSVYAPVSTCSCASSMGYCIDMPSSSHTLPLVSYASHIILRWSVAIWTNGWGELAGENVGWILVHASYYKTIVAPDTIYHFSKCANK